MKYTYRKWLGGVTVWCQTYYRQDVGSTPGRVAIKRLLLEQMTGCRLVNHPRYMYSQHQSQLILAIPSG